LRWHQPLGKALRFHFPSHLVLKRLSSERAQPAAVVGQWLLKGAGAAVYQAEAIGLTYTLDGSRLEKGGKMGLFSWLVLVGILISAIGGIIWWLAAILINKTKARLSMQKQVAASRRQAIDFR
jgi:hypothetical protein